MLSFIYLYHAIVQIYHRAGIEEPGAFMLLQALRMGMPEQDYVSVHLSGISQKLEFAVFHLLHMSMGQVKSESADIFKQALRQSFRIAVPADLVDRLVAKCRELRKRQTQIILAVAKMYDYICVCVDPHNIVNVALFTVGIR